MELETLLHRQHKHCLVDRKQPSNSVCRLGILHPDLQGIQPSPPHPCLHAAVIIGQVGSQPCDVQHHDADQSLITSRICDCYMYRLGENTHWVYMAVQRTQLTIREVILGRECCTSYCKHLGGTCAPTMVKVLCIQVKGLHSRPKDNVLAVHDLHIHDESCSTWTQHAIIS